MLPIELHFENGKFLLSIQSSLFFINLQKACYHFSFKYMLN